MDDEFELIETEIETGSRLTAPCPWCEGSGEEIVDYHGVTAVVGCVQCRGTGEVVELIGEGLPEIVIGGE